MYVDVYPLGYGDIWRKGARSSRRLSPVRARYCSSEVELSDFFRITQDFIVVYVAYIQLEINNRCNYSGHLCILGREITERCTAFSSDEDNVKCPFALWLHFLNSTPAIAELKLVSILYCTPETKLCTHFNYKHVSTNYLLSSVIVSTQFFTVFRVRSEIFFQILIFIGEF